MIKTVRLLIVTLVRRTCGQRILQIYALHELESLHNQFLRKSYVSFYKLISFMKWLIRLLLLSINALGLKTMELEWPFHYSLQDQSQLNFCSQGSMKDNRRANKETGWSKQTNSVYTWDENIVICKIQERCDNCTSLPRETKEIVVYNWKKWTLRNIREVIKNWINIK